MIKHEPNSNCIIIPLEDVVNGEASAWGFNSDDRYSRVQVQFDQQMGGHYLNHLTPHVIPTTSELKELIKPLIQELKDTTNDIEVYQKATKALEWLS